MVVLGIQKLAQYSMRSTIYIFHCKRALLARVMQYFKDRTDSFDGYYPCKKDEDFNSDHGV